MSADLIRLERTAHTPWGTLGTLRLPDGAVFQTIEPRWQNNAAGVSCIPAGEYPMRMRASPIVARTSGGQFTRGWEVDGVPGRDLIMIHPGNWATNSNGCVLVGRAHAVLDGRPGVTASRAAFKDLMSRLAARDEWSLDVRWVTPE